MAIDPYLSFQPAPKKPAPGQSIKLESFQPGAADPGTETGHPPVEATTETGNSKK